MEYKNCLLTRLVRLGHLYFYSQICCFTIYSTNILHFNIDGTLMLSNPATRQESLDELDKLIEEIPKRFPGEKINFELWRNSINLKFDLQVCFLIFHFVVMPLFNYPALLL